VDNIIEINCKIMNQSKLKIPKNRCRTPSDNLAPPPSDNLAPQSNRKDKVIEKPRRLRSAQRTASGTSDTVRESTERNRERVLRKAEIAGDKLTSTNLKMQWTLAAEHEAKPVNPPTGFESKDFYKFKNGFNAGKPGISLREFMRWCIREWVSVRNTELDWAKNVPPIPDLKVLSSLCRHFAVAYLQRSVTSARRAVRGEEILAENRDAAAAPAGETPQDLKRRMKKLELEKEHYKRLAVAKDRKRIGKTATGKTDKTGIPDPLGEWENEGK
jgi:hypothetical protein